MTLLHNVVEAASDDDGCAPLSSVGNIVTKQRPDFDSNTYGYAELSDLTTADHPVRDEPPQPGDSKPTVIYVRDRRLPGHTILTD
ncbi:MULTISPECIES: OST-HTH/LOTUS domain-containing protein [Amycolatopsis]|nr:OST-HTH/LOTUS domain-containing protein [Amycolatopsis bullii]